MSPDLHLLGMGLDAIVQRGVERMPRHITPEARILRYQRAVLLSPPDRWHILRQRFGAIFQAAWRSGMRPNLGNWTKQFQQIAKACEP